MTVRKLLKKCNTAFNAYIIQDKDNGHEPSLYNYKDNVITVYGKWKVYSWDVDVQNEEHIKTILYITV